MDYLTRLLHKDRHRVKSSSRRSALWTAVLRNKTQSAAKLLKAGHEPNEPFDPSVDDDQFSGRYDRDTRMLQVAMDRGNAELVEALLRHGASAPPGPLLLHQAIGFEAACPGRGLPQLLLERGADPAAADRFGQRPLHLAASSGLDGLAGLLLARGADPAAVDDLGRSPLLLAARALPENLRLAQLLLGAGAPLELADRPRRHRALHAAIAAGKPRTARLLLERGADVSAATASGKTPLRLALLAGAPLSLLERLLDGGAEVRGGLHKIAAAGLVYAEARGSEECLHLLVEFGADVDRALHGNRAVSLHGRFPLARRAVLKHFARLDAAAGRPLLNHLHPDALDFYHQCADEIRRLRSCRVYGELSLYDLLVGDRGHLALLLKRDPGFDLAVNSADYCCSEKFPLYKGLIDVKLAAAKRRRKFLCKIERKLRGTWLFDLPGRAIDAIMAYLKPGNILF